MKQYRALEVGDQVRRKGPMGKLGATGCVTRLLSHGQVLRVLWHFKDGHRLTDWINRRDVRALPRGKK